MVARGRGVVLAACLAVVGCGSGGGSNDQGVSFRALGVFQEQEQVAPSVDTFDAENPEGDSGRIISLSNTPVIPNDINGDGDLDGGFLGMRNELVSQGINVQGINVKIFIPGALLNNPVATDFVPLAVSLGPSKVAEGETLHNTFYSQTIVVSADVMAFLNQNRTLLPRTPFNMNIVMKISGISDSGDDFDTNEITYNVVVEP
jgi:hypothetical protein